MKSIKFEFLINSSIENTWNTLVSKDSIRLYFSPNINVDIKPGGPFEILFDMDAPTGEKGAEDMIVLSVVPYEMFSFTWNNPPVLSAIRNQRTVVNIYLKQTSEGTKVTFINSGFAYSSQWSESIKYFERAWGKIVLPRFKFIAENKCDSWNDVPDNLPQIGMELI